MSELPSGETPRPPRRKRYSGKNPKRFEDKYKEHAPEKYPETFAKVLASGKTPAGTHVPIMVSECLAALKLSPGMCGIDATLGHGGHALRILEQIQPGGKLLGLDIDPLEQPRTAARILAAGFDENAFEAIRSNYAGLDKVLTARGLTGVDFIYADLGCSSMQFDDPTRGFSYKHHGPLDMRMNPQRGLTASEWIERTTPEKFALALEENADEPRAGRLSEALAGRMFMGTIAFANAIRAALPGLDPDTLELSVRRVFQAVRISINEEFAAIDGLLRALPHALKPGGRVAVLSFHSGEDRRVKKAFEAGLRQGLYASISDGVILASPEERRENPRSSPAKLRWAEKCMKPQAD